MEEIDIIELLKRVKEGKAPKEIEIEGTKYFYNRDYDICCVYVAPNEHYNWLINNNITLDSKIKILDKPIIKELPENENIDIYDLSNKVNEIIRYLRSKDER